ncbi:hypothetical protein Sinac_4933 [Singulisphaera acidiphila DSM 18658]|uniref:Uncharacterized protein n=2 Tax=Singulisphaera acidiphila TaxID=466153 RepID=L0DI65_SINAD|nr:hypothetical protein Sinac_4933 [Singulisphaera acidiphila DSM 18658]
MNPICSLVLVGTWALLTSTPTRADAPAEATAVAPSPPSEPTVTRISVPDCPDCRKAAGLPTKPTGTTQGTTSASVSATKSATPLPGPTPRDPSLEQAQVLSTPDSPSPTIPEIPTEGSAARSAIPMIPTTGLAAPTMESEYPSIEDALIFSGRAAPAIPSQRPQRVPAPNPPPFDSGSGSETAIPASPASMPAATSPRVGLASGNLIPSLAETEEPKLPELPDDLKDPAPRTMPGRLDSPPSPPSTATAPQMLPPGNVPVSSHGGSAPMGEQGPSARILATTPLRPTIAMPPPVAGGTFDGVVAPMPVEGPGDEPSPLNSFSSLPVMIGDQSPASLLTGMAVRRSGIPGQPPTPPSPFARTAQSAALLPWARGFKIADNQSPMPQDRVFYSFNYFNNMNGDVNSRLGSPINDMQVYRQLLGLEKTFWRGNASVGVRLPIDTLWTNSADPSLRHNSTSVGDLTVFTKFLLYDNPAVGSLLSGGLAVTAPTGPASFAGSSTAVGFRNTQIQPFLGYILRRGDFYLQGFSAIDVPTDSRDVTMWYNDLAVGYFVYQSADPSAFLSAVVPTFEVHLNDPLNHRGALRPNDPAGTPDVLDLTFGTSFIIHKRLVATVGCSFPVTGPRPFDIEAVALLNFYYGRYGMAQPWPMPPVSR